MSESQVNKEILVQEIYLLKLLEMFHLLDKKK